MSQCACNTGPNGTGPRCKKNARPGDNFCGTHMKKCVIKYQQQRKPQQKPVMKPIFMDIVDLLFPDRIDKDRADPRYSFLLTDDENYEAEKKANDFVKKNRIPVGSVLYIGTNYETRPEYGYASVSERGVNFTEDFHYLEEKDEIRKEYPLLAEDIFKFWWKCKKWYIPFYEYMNHPGF
jgi:hypothetical protein